MPDTAPTELEAIYQDHRQGLFSLAVGITRCRATAEDAVHDAFARLCRHGDVPGDPVAYAFRAVRNAAIDQVRRGRVRAGSADSIYALPDTAPTPAEAAADAETRDELARTIEQLDPPHREVILLKIHGGLTFRQIADILDQPLPTVSSRYRRALEKLAEHMGACA